MTSTTETPVSCEMACMPPDIHVAGCPNAPHRSDVLNYEHFDCCGQGMVPKDEATQTFCPPSAVHERIVTWTDSWGSLLVFPGDLVLIGEDLQCVEAIAYDPPEDEAVRVDLEGWDVTHCVRPGALVAVRRYETEEDR